MTQERCQIPYTGKTDAKNTILVDDSSQSIPYAGKIRRWVDELINGTRIETGGSSDLNGFIIDIGKLYIEQKILMKPGKLDSNEWKKIKSHTVYGSAILIRHQDSIGVLPSIVALEHHRCFDSSGYPMTLFKHNLHIGSLIVSICDVYDAISSRRSYKQDYPPEVIYGLMIKDKGKRFSPELLNIFFKVIGVWPKNSLVLLNDKSVAVVREINKKHLFSPIVEVISKDSKEIIDLSKDKDIRIERSLNPFAEGKEYKTLI